jgi:hypothetical protein
MDGRHAGNQSRSYGGIDGIATGYKRVHPGGDRQRMADD